MCVREPEGLHGPPHRLLAKAVRAQHARRASKSRMGRYLWDVRGAWLLLRPEAHLRSTRDSRGHRAWGQLPDRVEARRRGGAVSTKSDDPYEIKAIQDPDDPTLVHVTMKLPAGKAVELGCLKYIGDPTYVGTFPERQDIPVEPKAPHPEKKVEPGVLSGTFSKVLEAVYRSDAPDDVVYEVVGNLLRAGITEPTPEDVEAMFRSVLNRRKDP